MNNNKQIHNSKVPWGRFGGVFDLDRWYEIWVTITHNKSRSFLTAFGVFWGMFMLVLMVGAGNALNEGIWSQLEGFAQNSCFFWTENTSEPYRGFQKGRRWNMLNSDVEIIRQKVPELQHISPMLFGGSSEKNVVRGEYGGSYQVKGCYPVYNEIDESRIIKGRFINDIDISENRKVCLIGQRVYEVLFQHGEDAIGKLVKVNGIYFQVVGVMAKMSNASIGGSADESVVLPFSTMQKAFNQGNIIHFMGATARPGIKVKVLEDKIKETLRSLHQISPSDKEAVGSMNVEDQFSMFNNLFIGIGALIWIVGLGTLLAGAIGVSNIMLVTVRERTKEIGIRRALGATPQNIIGQILTESVVLTVLAGIGGIVLGVGILSGFGVALSQSEQFFKDPQIAFSMAVGSLVILMIVGTFAGFIPAQRAMMIKPIEAIREE